MSHVCIYCVLTVTCQLYLAGMRKEDKAKMWCWFLSDGGEEDPCILVYAVFAARREDYISALGKRGKDELVSCCHRRRKALYKYKARRAGGEIWRSC